MKKIFTLIFASILALATYAQDVIEVTFDSFVEDPFYTPADTTISRRNGQTIITPENWLVQLENDTYRFQFNYYGPTVTGTYVLAEEDFDMTYTFGYNLQTKPYATEISFESCELTITETHPNVTTTRYILEADIISTDNVRYLVHATHDVLTATETITAEILDALITPTDYGFIITAVDNEKNLDIQLAINWSFGIEGYFSSKVVDTENTVITHNGESFDPQELTMEIVFVEELTNGKPGYRIPALQFFSPDVVAYDLSIEAPIIVTDTIDITCTNLTWDDSQKAESSIMFEASNETYSIFGMLSATSIKKGTYDSEKASVELTNIATSESIGALINTVVVEGNMLKGFTAEVEVLGSDSKLYLIHLSKSNETTNVENIEITTDTNKMIINGALVIIKNGVKYNTMGQIIK